jgi:hypothetical protein
MTRRRPPHPSAGRPLRGPRWRLLLAALGLLGWVSSVAAPAPAQQPGLPSPLAVEPVARAVRALRREVAVQQTELAKTRLQLQTAAGLLAEAHARQLELGRRVALLERWLLAASAALLLLVGLVVRALLSSRRTAPRDAVLQSTAGRDPLSARLRSLEARLGSLEAPGCSAPHLPAPEEIFAAPVGPPAEGAAGRERE